MIKKANYRAAIVLFSFFQIVLYSCSSNSNPTPPVGTASSVVQAIPIPSPSLGNTVVAVPTPASVTTFKPSNNQYVQ